MEVNDRNVLTGKEDGFLRFTKLARMQKTKLYGPFLWISSNCIKAAELLLVYFESPSTQKILVLI